MVERTPSPPRGWNSFDCYGIFANQRVLLENLAAFEKKLLPFGYEYFVLDAGWYSHFDILENEEFPRQQVARDLEMDDFGRVVEVPSLFPKGLKSIADQVHKAGCKFGIHIMRGIPRKAVRLNTPIKGTEYHARDIANTEDICVWNNEFYGVNMDHPGGQAYYDSVIDKLLSYDIDFIKADDITPFPKEMEGLAKAVEKAPRSIVLSFSPGNEASLLNTSFYQLGSMYRITSDIWDEVDDLQKMLDRWSLFENEERNSSYLDLDMIPFGALQVYTSDSVTDKDLALLAGKGRRRMSHFTENQKRFFITMLALAASPLMFGGELHLSDQNSLDLVTHPEILLCNANSDGGKQVFYQQYIDIRHSKDKTNPESGWIGIFNRNKIDRNVSFTHKDFQLETKLSLLYSIWDNKSLVFEQGKVNLFCPGLSVIFLKYTQ